MSKYKPSLIEKETIILFNEEENEAEIYTYNRKLIERQLRYRITSTRLDLSDEQGVIQEIEKGSPLEIYIGDRIPVQTQVEEQEENGMSMGM